MLEDNTFPISDTNVHYYKKLKVMSNSMQQIKQAALLIVMATIIVQYFMCWGWPGKPISSSLPSILTFLIALVMTHIINYFVHALALHKIKRIQGDGEAINNMGIQDAGYPLKPFKRSFTGFLLCIFSPDYIMANEYKSHIHKHFIHTQCHCKTACPISRKDQANLCAYDTISIFSKYFVIFSNQMNVICGCTLIFVTLFLWNCPYPAISDVILYIFITRMISRGIEVIVAFYKDVVANHAKIFYVPDIKNGATTYTPEYINNWKSTKIMKSNRISLAVHTLVEFTLCFGMIYFLLFNLHITTNNSTEVLDSLFPDSSRYFFFLLYSGSLAIFNFSFTSYPHKLWVITHCYQVFISAVLIILSIARYIGLRDELTEREKDFYLRTEDE